MGELVELLRFSGAWGYGVLALTMTGLVAAVVWTVLTATGRRVPAPLWFLFPALIAALTFTGEAVGVAEAVEAVSVAVPNMRGALLAAGMALTWQLRGFGLLSAASLLALSAVGSGVGLRISSKDDTRATTGFGLAVGGLAVAAGLGLLAWAVALDFDLMSLMLTGPVLLLAGVGCALAATRRGEGEASERRLATGQTVTGAMAAAAVLLWWLGAWAMSRYEVLGALKAATPDTRYALIDLGVRGEEAAVLLGGAALAVAALIALALLLRQVRSLVHGRAVVGAVVTLALAGLVAAPLALAASEKATVFEAMAEAAPGGFDALPRAVDVTGEEVEDVDPSLTSCPMERQGDQWRDCREGRARTPWQWGEEEPELRVPGELKARELAEAVWFKGRGELRVAARVERARSLPYFPQPPVAAVPLHWMMPTGHPFARDVGSSPGAQIASLERREVVKDYDTIATVLVDGPKNTWLYRDGELTPLGLPGEEGFEGRLVEALRGAGPDHVLLVTGARWTVQDLVSICLTARRERVARGVDGCVLAHETIGEWSARRGVKP